MSVIRLHTPAPAPVPKDELDRQAVGTAIVILHGEGRYYEAMDILCRVVGWPPLVRGFATADELDAWLAKMRGVPVEAAKEVKSKMRKCGSCARWFDPSKILQRKSTNACGECGRRFNSNGKGMTR